ncbi:MAG: hypothetical protein ACLQIB_08630, partial [Isosphaeraceae bacterium]
TQLVCLARRWHRSVPLRCIDRPASPRARAGRMGDRGGGRRGSRAGRESGSLGGTHSTALGVRRSGSGRASRWSADVVGIDQAGSLGSVKNGS